MSSAKFAAMTASLLARKGDAAPSVVVPVTAPPRPALVPRNDQPFHPKSQQSDNTEKLRRIVVSVTQEELERLCIAAIKKGTNRHDVVRGALKDYFRKLSAEFPYPCACLEGDPAVRARHAEPKARAAPLSYSVYAENSDSELLAMNAGEEQIVL